MQLTESPKAAIWWIIWFAVIACLIVLQVTTPKNADPVQGSLDFLPAIQFVGSVIVRWLVFPRVRGELMKFRCFVIGLALAEGCGILGIFIAPAMTSTYIALAFVALAMHFPLLMTPKGEVGQ